MPVEGDDVYYANDLWQMLDDMEWTPEQIAGHFHGIPGVLAELNASDRRPVRGWLYEGGEE